MEKALSLILVLFNRDRLSEVARFIDITATRDGSVVSKQLQRYNRQQRNQEFIRFRYHDDMVNVLLELRIASSGNTDDHSIAGLDFLDIRQRLLVNALLRS